MIRLMILVVALLSGAVTWWLFAQNDSARRLSESAAQPVISTVDVLVYAADLRRGTLLTPDALRWQPQLKEAIPTAAITRDARPTAMDDLKGSVLKTSVLAGNPLRDGDVVTGRAGFMSLVVAPNMRAISIRIAEDKSAGGFILPDDRVDVIHTVVRDDDGDGTASGISRTILYSVRVLAIGQTAAENSVKQTAKEQKQSTGVSSETVALGDTATLEVTEEQAELLAAAAASGQLTLSLRALDDEDGPRIGDLGGLEGAAPADSFVVYRGVTAEVVKCRTDCDPVTLTPVDPAPAPAPLPSPAAEPQPATETSAPAPAE